jgi:uncharacterized protein (DUF2141 family)
MINHIQFTHRLHSVGSAYRPLCHAIAILGIAGAIQAEEVRVTVTGIDERKGGEIGIALYPGPSGFPMESLKASCVWLKADATNITHSFRDLKPGTYAIAVSHDLNGNHVTDTSWVGIPKEPWGVSKNIRPRMRAPRFEECSFSLTNSVPLSLVVSVKQ